MGVKFFLKSESEIEKSNKVTFSGSNKLSVPRPCFECVLSSLLQVYIASESVMASIEHGRHSVTLSLVMRYERRQCMTGDTGLNCVCWWFSLNFLCTCYRKVALLIVHVILNMRRSSPMPSVSHCVVYAQWYRRQLCCHQCWCRGMCNRKHLSASWRGSGHIMNTSAPVNITYTHWNIYMKYVNICNLS